MILIFGAGGQVGQELAARAAAAGMPATALTRGEADICDARQVAGAIAAAKPAVVINAAAYTDVDQAEREPDAAMRANATGPGILAGHCAAAGLPLIHYSTDYVFDGKKTVAYREDDPPAPLGAYGRSKLAGEQAIRSRHAGHVIIRLAWVYGRYGRNFLKTMLRLRRERDEVRVVADQRGCPTATADIAEATILLMALATKGRFRFGTYHLAGTGETTWYGFAREIMESANAITGKAVTVHPISTSDYPTIAPRPANSALDSALFERTFGFRARPWQETTGEVVTQLCRAEAVH